MKAYLIKQTMNHYFCVKSSNEASISFSDRFPVKKKPRIKPSAFMFQETTEKTAFFKLLFLIAISKIGKTRMEKMSPVLEVAERSMNRVASITNHQAIVAR